MPAAPPTGFSRLPEGHDLAFDRSRESPARVPASSSLCSDSQTEFSSIMNKRMSRSTPALRDADASSSSNSVIDFPDASSTVPYL